MKAILVVSAVLLSLWSGSLSAKGKPVPEVLPPEASMPGTEPSEYSGPLGGGSATCSAAKKQQLLTQMAAQQCQSLSTHEERVECLLALIAVNSSCGCGSACPDISASAPYVPGETLPEPALPLKSTKEKKGR